MRLFGFSDAEARHAISRFVTTSSPDPIEDLWEGTPIGVWGKAFELAETLDPNKGGEFVNEAMDGAESPRDFWLRLEDSVKEVW